MALSRKIAFINLSERSYRVEPISKKLRENFLGGRGIDAYFLYTRTKPGIDPFSPENPLMVSAGLLVGTLASASARTHIMAKSPLTNLIGSANMGGFFAPELRFAGFDHLVVEGAADEWLYIFINDGKIEFRKANQLKGLSPQEAQTAIRDELKDQEIQVLSIGIAGENLVRFANVRTGLKNAGGRTGIGAVMGSKRLKAIAVRGTSDIKIAYPEEALKYNLKLTKEIADSKFGRIMQQWGTMFIYGVTNSTGLVRTRNFQSNQLPDSEDIECERIEDYSFGTEGCFGCVLHCRHKYTLNSPKYGFVYGQGPEYTSQGAFGAEVGCRSFETILLGNHLVNTYGLDTLETGSMIAWAFELYEKGILTDKETGGLRLEWGNTEAVLEMVERIAKREGLGDVLAEGPRRAAQRIGRDSEKYLIEVKGMSNLHSDERPTPSLALGIATATRGSDHLRSRPAIDLYYLPEPVLREIYSNPVPYNGPLSSDYRSYEGKAWQVFWHENLYIMTDILGICKFHVKFLSPNLMDFNHFSELLYYNTGLKISPQQLWEIAERAYNLERLFLVREGIRRKDDRLSDRYFDEPTPEGLPVVKGVTLDREKFNKMLDEYYEHHGWDKDGVPTPQTLARLSLNDL
ncbi:MAG: aldehyde ferredoxin oxidoreductase family protein [Planctomycetota bacterium]|nr:aldehyde ferredoxin oxidoreductase family protein [Planctomycetota bacterium]